MINQIRKDWNLSYCPNFYKFYVEGVKTFFLPFTWFGKCFPVDTGHQMNVHKTFKRRPGRLLNVLCTFNLRPVSTGLNVSW